MMPPATGTVLGGSTYGEQAAPLAGAGASLVEETRRL